MGPIVSASIILGLLILAFIIAGIVAYVLVKRNSARSNSSLSEAGQDQSDFSRQLTERYRNQG